MLIARLDNYYIVHIHRQLDTGYHFSLYLSVSSKFHRIFPNSKKRKIIFLAVVYSSLYHSVSCEDIVTTDSPGELDPGPDPSPLPPGLWPGSGQLSRSSLQDLPGLPGLAGGLPGLGRVLLGVRLLPDPGELGAGDHLQGL